MFIHWKPEATIEICPKCKKEFLNIHFEYLKYNKKTNLCMKCNDFKLIR